MYTYTLTEELTSQTRIFKYIYLKDFFFIMFYAVFTYYGASLVHSYFKLPYIVGSIIICIYLIIPSSTNAKRRNWQGLVIFMQKKNYVYRPVRNISANITLKEYLEQPVTEEDYL